MTTPDAAPLPRHLHATLDKHVGPVHVATYAKGTAKYVLTGGADRSVRLWNPLTAAEIKAYKGHGYEVLSIAVTPDNSQFASSGGDRTAFVWDVQSGETTRRFQGHMGKVNAVCFNSDASVLASASYDQRVRLWDMKSQSRTPIQTLEDARDSVTTVCITPTEIISGSVDGHVRTYDLRQGQLRSDYIGHPVTSIVPTKDGSTLLVATLDSSIRLLDCSNGTVLNTFKSHVNDSYRTRACFGHGEATVVAGDENGQVWCWDLVTGNAVAPNPPPKAHNKVITWTEHHPTQQDEMITASADGTVKVWKYPSS
ncbi:nuclear mRNA splicing protein [Clavulina sp. PMI_390]|nr:nuclear mRNA splicing protein [Clavulina sp. PMI_390]